MRTTNKLLSNLLPFSDEGYLGILKPAVTFDDFVQLA